MLTTKQVTDILSCPYLYTKKKRQEATKTAIRMLDKMAEADGAKEQINTVDADLNTCPECGWILSKHSMVCSRR